MTSDLYYIVLILQLPVSDYPLLQGYTGKLLQQKFVYILDSEVARQNYINTDVVGAPTELIYMSIINLGD